MFSHPSKNPLWTDSAPAHQATTMSSVPITAAPHVVEDCLGLVRVLSDGSIIRSSDPIVPGAFHDDATIEWKEVLFDPTHDLPLRLYKPRDRLPSDPQKLPIFFYFHGGGFCIASCTCPTVHSCCLRLASTIRAVVVSPDYRLAPEHRLPAAIDDGASALLWLRAQAAAHDPDPWLADSADFERVFVSGESAGGNIAHHLAFRVAPNELAPLRVRGFVLLMPFFGGAQRTKSEAVCPVDVFLNLKLNDQYWRLALPAGANADHWVANPFGQGSPCMEAAQREPMLVVVGEKDMLRDREVEYAERLKGWGKAVELVELAGKHHGFFAFNASSSEVDDLLRIIKKFVEEK